MEWCTIATLEYDGDLIVPVELGNDVSLIVRPNWLTEKAFTSGLSDEDRTILNVKQVRTDSKI